MNIIFWFALALIVPITGIWWGYKTGDGTAVIAGWLVFGLMVIIAIIGSVYP